jgi:hypothetical protein
MSELPQALPAGAEADPPHEVETAAASSAVTGSETSQRVENMACIPRFWLLIKNPSCVSFVN